MESVVACAAAAVRLFLLALPPAVLAAVLAAPAFAQADPLVAVFISDSPGGMISAGWSGNANVQNEGTVPHGTRVTFTATPDPGHQFSGWTGDCAGAANPCVREATANVRVGAAFCTKSLDAAIDDGDLAQVQCHLDGGTDINAGFSTNSRTLLHWAVINRRPQNVRLLLMVAGIDPNRQDGVFGSNPLIESAFTDQADITGILVNHPLVSLNIASNSGNTALHTAAERGHLAVVNTLLAAGAEANPPANNAGRTPLGEALVNHHLEVAARLLAAGGNHGTDCVANEVANPNSATPPCLVPATTPQTVFISEAVGGTISAGWSGGSDLASGEAVPAGATVTFRAAAGAGGRLKQWGDACAGRLVSPPECVWNVLAAVTVSAVFECTGPFQNAARFGDIPVASCHLEHGADVNAGVATRSRTPLHWAVIGVRPEMVRFLLAVPGVDVNKSDTINGNPLVAAGHAGNAEVAGLLANHPGIVLDAVDGGGNTALHLAAAGGHLAVVNTLLAAGAMVNTLNVAGRTALGEARNANRDAIALRLLGAGGHYGTACGAGQAVNPDSATPPCVAGAAVFISVSANGTVSAEWFADADLQNEDAVPLGTTVTFTALPAADYYVSGWSGDCEPVGQAGAFDAAGAPRMCELPVMKNVTVGAVFAAGCAKSLRVAARQGDLAQVQCNFNLGAGVNDRGGANNRVPLHWAVIGQQAETVRELLTVAGIDPNLQDTTYGSNALIESAFNGYAEIAGILANHSLVSLNITDNNDNTALHTAAARGHLAVVNTLLAAGVEVNPPLNSDGRTPLGEARNAGHQAIVDRLIEAGGHYGTACPGRTVNPASAAPPCVAKVFISASTNGTVSAEWSGDADVRDGETVPPGTAVTFTATPDPGHSFSAWTDACAGAANPCVREVTVNVTVGADFQAGCAKPLDVAAREGDRVQVQCNFSVGAGVNDRGGANSRVPLHWAVIGQQAETVRELLTVAGIDPNLQDLTYGSNPLIEAAFNGYAEIAGILANHPLVSLNIVANDGGTALHTAAGRGHLAVVNTLLAAGAEVNPPTNNAGRTPLGEAQNGGHDAIALRLLGAGGHYGTACGASQAVNPASATPPCVAGAAVFISVSANGTVSAEWFADADLQNEDAVPVGTTVTFTATPDPDYQFFGWTGACAGAANPCAREVTAAVTVGADFREICTKSLVAAARQGDLAQVQCNFIAGAGVNDRGGANNRVPLHWAVIGQQAETVRELLTVAGIDPNLQDTTYGSNPLIEAAFQGYDEIAGILASHSLVSLNITDNNDNTALHTAAARGHLAVVNTLLAAGAEVNPPPNTAGRTPLGEARNAGHQAIVDRLIESGGHYGTACPGQAVNPAAATPPCLAQIFITDSPNGTVSAEWSGDANLQNEGTVPPGTTVTFTATPDSDYEFSAWTGACQGEANPCALGVSVNVTVGADFAPEASPEGFTAAELHEYYFPAANRNLHCGRIGDADARTVAQNGVVVGHGCFDEGGNNVGICFQPNGSGAYDPGQSLEVPDSDFDFIAPETPICSENLTGPHPYSSLGPWNGYITVPCVTGEGELDSGKSPFGNTDPATCPLDDFYAAHVAKGGTDPRPATRTISYSKLPGGHAGNGGTLAEADGRASGFQVAAGATVTFTAAPNPGWTVTWNDESGCDDNDLTCEVVAVADVNLTAIFGTGDDALLEKYFPAGGNQHCATVGGNTDPLTHPGGGGDVIGRECFGVSVGETACVQLGESFDPSRDIWNSNGDILNDYSSGIPPLCSQEYPPCVSPEEQVVSGNPFSGCAVPVAARQVSYSKLPGGHESNGGAVTVIGQQRDAPFEVAPDATVTFTATPNPGWTVTWNDESGCDDEELTCEVIASGDLKVTAIFDSGNDALLEEYFPAADPHQHCQILGGHISYTVVDSGSAPFTVVGRLCARQFGFSVDCMQLGNAHDPVRRARDGDEIDLLDPYPPLCSEEYPPCDGDQIKPDGNPFATCEDPREPVTVFISTSANGIVSAEWSGDSDVQDEETVPHRTAVTFTASPDSDFYVVGWSGDCDGVGAAGGAPGASRTCELTARKNVTVGAVFVRAATVFISTSANGTVSAEWSGDADLQNGEPVPAGTTVTFTAEPAANFYVSGWSGGCDGVGAAGGFNAPGTPQPCELGVGAEVTVGAVFTLGLVCDSGFVIENGECVLDPAALYEHYFPAADRVSKCQNFSGDNEVAVEVRDPGAADTTADVAYICHTKPPSDPNRDVCYQREDGDHAAGLVGLRTHPGAYNFTSADTPPPVCSELFPPCLDASGALDDIQNPFADNCTGMPPAPVSVFISEAPNGTVSAEWSGDAEVLDGETVPHRTAVTFTATPDLGYEISMWSGACDGALKTETQCVATATENLRVSVLFADLDECAAATHDCTAANAVCANTPGDFVCECASGYSGDGLTCDSDKAVEISSVANGSLSASPSESPVSHGTTVTFTAEPDSGYEISEWSGACDGTAKTESKCVATATVNLKVSVLFSDIDECARETHGCAPTGGVCTNTAGAYECSCGPGFAGDGRDCGGGDRRVSLLASENGSLSAEPGRALVANGTTVTFTATPDSGYEISLWLEDCAGASGPTCALPVTMDVSVGVSFADVDECATATDNCAADGGVCTNTPGDFSCECDSGYSGDGLVCDSDKAVEISPVENGSLSASPSESPVLHGTTVTFTASPDSGYEISEWFGACDDTPKTESKCVATATVNLKVSVAFSDIDECATALHNCAPTESGGVCKNTPGDFACECASGYSGNGLTCEADGEADKRILLSATEGGTVFANPAGPAVAHGTTVTFTTTPVAGYRFSLWLGDCAAAAAKAECVLTATVNVNVSAEFGCLDFHESATAGDVAGLECNLSRPDADADEPNAAGATPLMVAVSLGHSAAAEALLDAGAQATLRDAAGRTVLDYAPRAAGRGLVRRLIGLGAAYGAADCESPQVVNPQPGGAPCADCPAGEREVNGLCIDEAAPLLKDASTCRDVFRGEWVQIQPGAGICSEIDINDTFCIGEVDAASPLSCLGLFNHVRSCNMVGRPALDPWHCAAACPSGRAAGARCLAE